MNPAPPQADRPADLPERPRQPDSVVPDPPDVPDILIQTVPAGTPLFHSHHRQFGPTVFNPGPRPGGRFSSFTGPDGSTLVPAYYAGLTEEVAVAETILHDVPLTGGQVTWAQRATRIVSVVRCTRDLRLGQLHSAGLRRLGLSPRQLTDTEPADYFRTVEWAAAIHAAHAEVDGLIWTSARWNSNSAILLFGDRLQDRELHRHVMADRDFSQPDDHDWLLHFLDLVHVVALGPLPATGGQ